MSTGGLEPPQLSPHAPQACVSTIPPHRHNSIFRMIILLNCQFVYMIDAVDVPSSGTLSENAQWFAFSCGRVPHRHNSIFRMIILLNCQFVYMIDAVDVPSSGTLSENAQWFAFSCGRVPHRHRFNSMFIIPQKIFHTKRLLKFFVYVIKCGYEADSFRFGTFFIYIYACLFTKF